MKKILMGLLMLCAVSATAQNRQVRVVLVGDSTVNAGGGWGGAFCKMLKPADVCINLARNGRSSKSFRDEGLWAGVLEAKGDYVLIQFGHNDMPGKGPARETDPETSYADNMRRYVREVRATGGQPVVVTSLSRRQFKDGKLVEDLAAYALAARRVAAEEKVPLVDLNRLSTALLSKMSQAEADQFDALKHPDAKTNELDRTHLNEHGAEVFGRMVAEELVRVCPALNSELILTSTGAAR